MVEQIKLALAAGVDETRVDFAGMDLLLKRVSEGEFLLQVPGQSDAAPIYAAPTRRPGGYPASLPFIPGETVSVGNNGRTLSLTWWAPEHPQSLLDQIDEQCRADGWESGGEITLAVLGVTQRAYARGNTQRIVAFAEPTITLNDTNAPEP
jgi:hypothetical protein